jgi:methyltransferase (TIGR00027 family)
MRANRSSITAENNALLRAYESRRPAGRRICSDPYAAHFISASLQPLDAKGAQALATLWGWDTLFPGVGNAIIARTRFMDDCLRAALADGVRQVVLLGAGYDTRALRFINAMDGVTVFELDHPATQKIKLARLGRIGAATNDHVRYLAVDLASDALDDCLFDRGYLAQQASLFIWEGVTYYLPMASVHRVLTFVAAKAASGSRLVFDYFPPCVVDGTSALPEARALRYGLKHIGEELQFGLSPQDLQAFIETNGFRLIKHYSCRQFVRRKLAAIHQKRRVSDIFFFVEAVVRGDRTAKA